MRKCKTSVLYSIVLITLLLLTSCSSESNINTHHQVLSSQLDNMLESEWTRYTTENPGMPGGVALRVISERDNFFNTCGMETGVDENSKIRVASITKTFTAAGILLLQQRGLLNINDTLTSNIPGRSEPYLPDTPEYAIPYKNSITIKQVLEHRAGIFDINNSNIPQESSAPYAGQNYTAYILKQNYEHTFTLPEVIGVVASNNLSYFPPGSDYHYSDTGYSILGKIIEQVSGENYGDFITTNFLKPNGMKNSSLPYLGTEQVLTPPFVKGYDYMDGQLALVEKDNISLQLANGNLVTTPEDLALWGSRLYTGKAGLEKEYIDMMMDTIPVTEETGYGLGCKYTKGLGYGHAGAIRGYLSMMVYDPENKLTIVIYTNTMNWNKTAPRVDLFKSIILKTREILGYTESKL